MIAVFLDSPDPQLWHEHYSAYEELGPERYERYSRSRQSGCLHGLGLIVATGKTPVVNRRDERWRRTDESKQFGRKAPSKGKYQAGLARYPGDPTAFVSSMAEAKSLARKRGLEITDGPADSDWDGGKDPMDTVIDDVVDSVANQT